MTDPSPTRALIGKLIKRPKNFTVVRDQIAAILKSESLSQQSLAAAANEDSRLWKLRVFTERSNPWGVWLNNPPKDDSRIDTSPIVNVSISGSQFDKSRGDVVERQTSDSTFWIDVYGYGKSRDDGNPGHIPGDQDAAFEVHRAVGLVQDFLMSAGYVDLGMRKVVGSRWISSVDYSPVPDERATSHIYGARITFDVSFNEYSPQFEGVPLELISAAFLRAETGEILLAAEFPIGA